MGEEPSNETMLEKLTEAVDRKRPVTFAVAEAEMAKVAFEVTYRLLGTMDTVRKEIAERELSVELYTERRDWDSRRLAEAELLDLKAELWTLEMVLNG